MLQEFRNSTSESNVNSVGLDFVNPLQNVINTQPSRYSIFSSIAEASGDQRPDSVVTFEPLPKVLPSKFSNLRSQQFNGNSYDVGFIEDWLGQCSTVIYINFFFLSYISYFHCVP